MFTGSAICSPSRQPLLTGVYPVRNGAYPNHSRVHDGIKSLIHHLKPLGCRSALWGKRHIGPEAAFPFDYLNSTKNSTKLDDLAPIGEFMSRSKQPFFLVVASDDPHGPHDKGIAARYEPMTMQVPGYMIDSKETQTYLKEYGTEVEFVDRQVGWCLDKLDQAGLTDNTIVIFLSDNGTAYFGKWTCYDAGLRMPFIMRYPGKIGANTRIGALTQFVDLAPTLIDLAGGNSTKIDVGRPDATGKMGFDGKSFKGLFSGRSAEFRDYVYAINTTKGIINGNDNYPIRMVRDRQYAYIRNLNHEVTYSNVITNNNKVFMSWLNSPDPAHVARAKAYLNRPAEELYDIRKDPYQLRNIADDPALAGKKRQLAERLTGFMAQQGDKGVATELEANTRRLKGAE